MSVKKFISIILLMIFLNTYLVGCERKYDNSKEPITFTFLNCDLSEDNDFDDEVAKKITELTGVTLKIIHPSQGTNQAISLMLASGEYPDLIFAKNETSKLVEAGAIIKLDEYIEEKGNNLKRLYGNQLNRLKISEENPHIYTVGTGTANDGLINPSGVIQIQHQALKELGYPKIKTIYDLEKVISEYIAKNPKTENGEDRIGLSLMASDWRWMITCGNIASAAIGIPDDGQFSINGETGEATYKFTIPEIKEYFKWLNHMYDIGLLDPESFTQKEDVYRAKIASGRVVALSDQIWNYSDSIKILEKEGKDEETYAKLPILLNETNYEDKSLREYGFTGSWGISISKTCKDKDRAFEFLDWMASDEAQILINWGIEGVHYFYNEEGKREFYPEYKNIHGGEVSDSQENESETSEKYHGDMIESGIGYYSYPFPQRSIGELDSSGNSYTSITQETVKNNYSKAEKETLAAYEVDSWIDLFAPVEESSYGRIWEYYVESNSEIDKIKNEADEYCQQAITEAILGEAEDFDKAWDEIQEVLKRFNIDKLNEEMTKLVQEKIRLWNKRMHVE